MKLGSFIDMYGPPQGLYPWQIEFLKSIEKQKKYLKKAEEIEAYHQNRIAGMSIEFKQEYKGEFIPEVVNVKEIRKIGRRKLEEWFVETRDERNELNLKCRDQDRELKQQDEKLDKINKELQDFKTQENNFLRGMVVHLTAKPVTMLRKSEKGNEVLEETWKEAGQIGRGLPHMVDVGRRY